MVEEYELGKIYKETNENGNLVDRMCVGKIDPKYIEQQKLTKEKINFAPMFVKNGVVFLVMSPTGRTLTEEEREKRAKLKAEKTEAWKKQKLASAMKIKADAEARIAKLKG